MNYSKALFSTSLYVLGLVLLVNMIPNVVYAGPSTSQWDQIRQEIKQQGESVDGLEIPYLEAREIEIERDFYQPGEIVSGSVKVRNGGAINATGIVPTISLVGDFEDIIPTRTFDIDNSQEVFSLAPGETKTLFFSYTLPEVFQSNDLGIQVEFFTDTGLRQDLIHTKFEGRGEVFSLKLTNPKIDLRGNEYDLRITPAVYLGDEFGIKLNVESDENITVRPWVDLHVFSAVTGAIAETFDYTDREIKVGQQELKLPIRQTLPSGLYEGALYLTDTNGVQVAPTILFLFMVVEEGASPFMMRNITAEQNPNNDRQQIFTVSYTAGAPDIDIFLEQPAPFDDESNVIIDTDGVQVEPELSEENGASVSESVFPEVPDYSNMTVEVQVKDNDGKIVGEGSMPANVAGDFTIEVPVVVGKIPTATYLVNARSVTADGLVVDEYEKELVLRTNFEGGASTNTVLNAAIVLLAVLIIVIIIIVLIRFMHTSKKEVHEN